MPRLLKSTASCSSACVPMTIPASPDGDLVAHLLLLLRRHRSGQQRHAGRVLGAAELAGHRQRPKDVAHRAGMLRGKDFRRSEQRALVARIDHLQHRQHRHDGFSRADLTLQHPVHRTGSARVLLTAFRALPAGRWSVRTASCSRECREQPVVLPRRRRPGFAQFTVAAGHQCPLQPERFVVGEALARTSARLRSRRDGSHEVPRPRISDCARRTSDSGSGSPTGSSTSSTWRTQA